MSDDLYLVSDAEIKYAAPDDSVDGVKWVPAELYVEE